MTKEKLKRKLVVLVSLFSIFLPFSFAMAGIILSTHKYAWSNNVGYINFANVIVNNSTLSGYAWSKNAGWINFAPSQGGVLNDGTGNLSGFAWGARLGWIDFDNVLINGATGQFSGTATGALVGTINFDCPTFCDVVTDWRPTSPVTSPSGGGGGGILPALIPQPSFDSNFINSAQAKLTDIQKDGIINILDFNALMVSWDSTQNLAAVGSAFSADIIKFNALMVYWGVTYQL